MSNLRIGLLMPSFFIRSLTNNGDRAKAYFLVAKAEGLDPALVIKSRILSRDIDLYGETHKVIKKFGDYYLFERGYSIKIDTLSHVVKALLTYHIFPVKYWSGENLPTKLPWG